jgi:putative membrane protein
MAITKSAKGNKDERLLILAVDVDNDLYRKTKISGPLTGRLQILNAAKELALADPQDPDSNTMFYAVNYYDKLKDQGYLVNVATITGSELEGYHADREIARQLELVLESNKSDACILITDGASDQRVLPIIESRIKINGVQVVTLKQAESLENTYFTVLEKLKEPHYARIVFGLPAVLLLLFAISYAIGTGWQLPVGLIGLYLLIKGFGLEEAFISSFRGFGFSIDRMSFVFYLSALLFLVAGAFISNGNYTSTMKISGVQSLAIANAVEGFLIVLPIVLILYLIGRIIDVRASRHVFRTFKYGIYLGSSVILWVLLYAFTEWLNAQIYFGQLLEFTIAAILLGVAISATSGVLRRQVLLSKRLKDKQVVNELGALIGKVSKVDARHGRILINTSFGNLVTYGVDRITEILPDRVVIN